MISSKDLIGKFPDLETRFYHFDGPKAIKAQTAKGKIRFVYGHQEPPHPPRPAINGWLLDDLLCSLENSRKMCRVCEMKVLLICLFLIVGLARGQNFMESFEKRFAKEKPQVGELLSEAQGYDLEGNPFALSQLKGEFTVVVSGCFT